MGKVDLRLRLQFVFFIAIFLSICEASGGEMFHFKIYAGFHRSTIFNFDFSDTGHLTLSVKQDSYSNATYQKLDSTRPGGKTNSSQLLSNIVEINPAYNARVYLSKVIVEKESLEIYKSLTELRDFAKKKDTFSRVMFDGYGVSFTYLHERDSLKVKWSNFASDSPIARLILSILNVIERENLSYLVNESIYNFYRFIKQPGWELRCVNSSPLMISILAIPDSCSMRIDSFAKSLPIADTLFVDLRFYNGPYTYCFYDGLFKNYSMVYWIERPLVNRPPMFYEKFYRW